MRLFLIKKKKKKTYKKCISFSRGLFFQLMLCYMIPGSYKDIIQYYNRLYSKATVGRNHFVKHTIIANLSFPSELTYLELT